MSEVNSAAIRTLAAMLEARTGQQLVTSRVWRIETSLKPLLRERGMTSTDQLVAAMLKGSEHGLADRVIEALLNNETFFFRDHGVFQLLNGDALELLRTARMSRRRLRIWCAGCSTGQEAYSIAMMIADAPERWQGWTIDILGTDISSGAVERAQTGIFSQFEIQRGLPITMMMRWFDQEGENWYARSDLKRRVQFRRHNVLEQPPMPGRFDLILCRNVLLYFPPAVRTAAFERLASAIEPDGVLMLGAGETVLGQTAKFASERELRGLYRPASEAESIRAA
ncbi:protein-glutamate O-methyltransferase CheR [Sphingomonas sp. LaA6.9]|uniref:CheR family methyltransferase n=1 Tax=Sphingomonas sp. LaA6.9 TaxID=2919914 RepID=UPI001F4F86B9|nr:protein-glutamate O-methyltransferase CheR [Sphingomonas sp. LaA6.9]MCJ8157528.1 protein-glutamate O-methyltransferase CheR [Sphingomonas sp. LaA6.9]